MTAAGPPAAIKLTAAGGIMTAAINTAFAAPLQVLVTDAGGNPVAGVSVKFSVPATGASATSPPFTANATAGSYTAIASVSGIAATATFNLRNIAAPALPSGNAVQDAYGMRGCSQTGPASALPDAN